MTGFHVTVSRATPFCLALFVLSCGGDRSRSPTCGLAVLAGPSLIQQQLTILPYVLTAAPRGLPGSLPARIAGRAEQGEATVTYAGQGLALAYQGPNFPSAPTDSTVYALLVVDDSSQRAVGVLIYEGQRPPPTYPELGTVRGPGGGKALPLYGVRVDWASVSNPRCPLLGAPVQPPQ